MTFLQALAAWNGGVARGAKRRFSEALRVSESVVGQWSSGRNAPGEETRARIAQLLRLERPAVDAMFRGAADPGARLSALEREVGELRTAIAELRLRAGLEPAFGDDLPAPGEGRDYVKGEVAGRKRARGVR